MIDKLYIDGIIMNTLKEDMPHGDITTDNIISASAISEAVIIAKEEGIVAGLDVFKRVFTLIDDEIEFTRHKQDGDRVFKGDVIIEIKGRSKVLLKGERTALNLLQRMSGIATITNRFCKMIEDLPAKIVDTRKTTPNLRYLEKYAVRVGGGTNHRYCLSDGVLIKDNHIKAAGGIKNAVDMVRNKIPHTIKIEVETETLEQVQEALDAKADIIMLDNMDNNKMKEAVKLINKRALVEASGNVSIDRVREIALTGVDIISVGKLTHSVNALDISMKIR